MAESSSLFGEIGRLNDASARYFVARGSDDSIEWFCKILILNGAFVSQLAFWELRGIFNNWKWEESWHISRWVQRNLKVWERNWTACGLSSDGFRLSMRAAVRQQPTGYEEADFSTEHAMATPHLVCTLGVLMNARRIETRTGAKDTMLRMCWLISGADSFLNTLHGDGRCRVGLNVNGWCRHLANVMETLEAARTNSTFEAALTEALRVVSCPSCLETETVRTKLVTGLADVLDGRLPQLPTDATALPHMRGRKRSLRIDPNWCMQVAVDSTKAGRSKSATQVGRAKQGNTGASTYRDASMKVMSRYAWNLPRTLHGESQFNISTDASWGSGKDNLTIAVCSRRSKICGWAPQQVMCGVPNDHQAQQNNCMFGAKNRKSQNENCVQNL